MSDVSLSKAVRTNLLSLQNTASMMNKTQERLATGNKVNSALDNPSNFFTATSLNARASDMGNLLDSMASGIKVIEAANNGLTSLTKNLESMQSTLRQARQDKSFQTQSFEVTDASVLKLSGGQLGDGVSEVSLATATIAGTKASVGTTANTAYAGPAIVSTAEAGAGARTVLNVSAGVSQNDTFTVAGVTVTATNAAPDAANLVTDIKSALQGNAATKDKYTVSVGVGDNAGKVVIETVDASAAAASVNFDADNNPITGVNAATKGSTTFNYSAVSTTVDVGGQNINVGATFDEFVANLTAGGTAGNYSVSVGDNQQITVASKDWGGAAPAVSGVPTYAAEQAATKASNQFVLDTSGSAQNLTIAGATGTIAITSGMTDANVKLALEADTGIAAAYDVTINSAGNFSLTAKTAGAATAPTVSSDVTAQAVAANTSGDFLTGVDFTATTALTGYDGQTLDLGGGATFTFDGTATTDDLITALTTAGFTAAASGTAGFNITRADGAAFDITVSGSLGAAFGASGGTLTVDNGQVEELSGLTAGTSTNGTALVAEVNGTQATAPSAGASSKMVAATTDMFNVTYDGKTANVSIGAIKGGSGPDAIAANALDINSWQTKTVTAVNAQLQTAGITGVEAKFDSEGKFSLVAKAAEDKTLVVSGADAVALFGTSGLSTGVAEKSELNATKTVDKFVELINRDHSGKVRASNDNGKLRIENLSTSALSLGVDANGNNVVNPLTIAGNSVRDNLSKQFNDLRDQMDKLSDDASFNGINLLRGDKLSITFNESGSSSINIQSKDKMDNARSINASNLGIESLAAMDLDTDEGIDAFLGKISTALSDIRSQSSTFGSNLSAVENRQSFTKSMINTLETGAANLTLADMNAEAANLLALQTRQSLSSSALSMASQADQSVLQLLR